jgi:hypothetical protein
MSLSVVALVEVEVEVGLGGAGCEAVMRKYLFC